MDYFVRLIDDKNYDENKLHFIKKFLEFGGMRILEKIIYMQKEDIIILVNSIIKLIESKDKLTKEKYEEF